MRQTTLHKSHDWGDHPIPKIYYGFDKNFSVKPRYIAIVSFCNDGSNNIAHEIYALEGEDIAEAIKSSKELNNYLSNIFPKYTLFKITGIYTYTSNI